MSATTLSLKEFLTSLRTRLVDAHRCPVDMAEQLLNQYGEELRVLYEGGIVASVPVRWLYAEWKTFHPEDKHAQDSQIEP